MLWHSHLSIVSSAAIHVFSKLNLYYSSIISAFIFKLKQWQNILCMTVQDANYDAKQVGGNRVQRPTRHVHFKNQWKTAISSCCRPTGDWHVCTLITKRPHQIVHEWGSLKITCPSSFSTECCDVSRKCRKPLCGGSKEDGLPDIPAGIFTDSCGNQSIYHCLCTYNSCCGKKYILWKEL